MARGLWVFGRSRDYQWGVYDPLMENELDEGASNPFAYAMNRPSAIVDYFGLQTRGGRRITGKPSNTPNPTKKFRWDPKKQRWKFKDKRTGKWRFKPPGWVPPGAGIGPVILPNPNSLLPVGCKLGLFPPDMCYPAGGSC